MTSVLISLLQTLRGFVRSGAALHLEVLALRHQLQVLERSRPKRLRLVTADRCLWGWLSMLKMPYVLKRLNLPMRTG